MGLGAIMAGIGAAVGSAVANAASGSSSSKKPSSSSSSGSSGSGNKTSSTSTSRPSSSSGGQIGSASYTNKPSSSGGGSSGGGSGSSTGTSSGTTATGSILGNLFSQLTANKQPAKVTSDADLQSSNPQAYQRIQQYKNQYNEAQKLGDQAGMDKAHQLAEILRASYGYSGGLNGSGSTQLSTAQTVNNPYAGNKYISDYDNLSSITKPYKDLDGNWGTEKADMGVQFDIYDQINNLEHDDLARAQYKHWRALATGGDELLSIRDKQILGLPMGYTVTKDPRAFYDRSGTTAGGSSGGTSGGSAAGSGLGAIMAGLQNTAATGANTGTGTLAAQMMGAYQPMGTYNDADLQTTNPQAYQQIQQYKQQYADAQARGDTAAMNEAWQAAEAIRAVYGYSGGADGSQYIPLGGGYSQAVGSTGTTGGAQTGQSDYQSIIDGLLQAQQSRDEQYQAMMDSINQQYAAALGQMQANLDAQRQEAAKQTALDNAAAERAYMATIKPNGSLAENLAANGLLTTGLTESSQIAAGNTYQNALNQNATTQTEALAELERLAIQAEYTNDVERLQAIQQIMQQIAENGYASAQDIAQIQQWGIENSQNNYYQQQQIAQNQQQINMQLQQLELQKQQLELDAANGEIDRQTAQAQLEYLNQQIEELKLTNQYNKYQLGQLGL